MKLASLVLAIAAFSAPGRADAECGIPTWIGTPSGAKIPATGALYLYSEGLELRTHSRVGGPIVRETKISDTVIRLDYATKADELAFDPEADDARTFQIDRGWRPPQAAPRVLQYWHNAYAWTCSSSDSLMIQIDQPTAAFRVRWQRPGAARREWVIPARTADHNVNVVELGKLDCGTTSIDPAELAAGGALSLVAIRYDGSEVAVTGLPATLSTARMVTTDDGLGHALTFLPGTEPIAPVPVVQEPAPDVAPALFLVVSAFVAVLLVVRFRHRALKSVV